MFQVWRGRAQMQRVSVMEEEEMSGRRASIPCKGKSAGDREKVEESRERKGGMHGQAMRSAARMEEEFNRRVKEEGRRALWERRPRRGAIIRIRMVHKGNDSDICRV